MSEYIIEIPDEYFASYDTERNMYYPDERDSAMPITPFVRCRDCMKWHHIDTLDGVRYGECDEWKRADSYCVPATRENGFCAWAACKCGEDIETNGRESVICPSCGRVIRV